MKQMLQPAIILVDDEPDALLSMEMTLRVAGFTNVVKIQDACKAAKLIEETNVDLAILDILMPGISGIDLLRKVRLSRPDLSVIMATSSNEVEKAVTCMKLGAADYLVKPLSRERFIDCVKNVLCVNQIKSGNHAQDKEKYFTNFSNESPLTSSQLMEKFNELADTLQLTLPNVLPEQYLSLSANFYEHMVTRKSFTQPEMTLSLLALRMNTNTSYLSQFVNEILGTNFRQIINRLRIAEFIKQIQNAHPNLSIDSVFENVGFTRKATFYEAFKQITGKTPSQWFIEWKELKEQNKI